MLSRIWFMRRFRHALDSGQAPPPAAVRASQRPPWQVETAARPINWWRAL